MSEYLRVNVQLGVAMGGFKVRKCVLICVSLERQAAPILKSPACTHQFEPSEITAQVNASYMSFLLG
jgi:hypothetical protein